MLDGRAYALALQAIDVRHRRSRRQERVFTEVFEVTAAHRSTVNVDSRPEHEVHPAGAGVLANNRAHSLHQVGVPGGRKPNTSKSRGRSIISDPNRSIGHLQTRQPNLLNVADVEVIDSADKVNLLLQG